MKGVIRLLKSEKYFGFIKAEDGHDYFFHASALLNTKFAEVVEGQEVEFEPSEGEKGLRAEQVTV